MSPPSEALRSGKTLDGSPEASVEMPGPQGAKGVALGSPLRRRPPRLRLLHPDPPVAPFSPSPFFSMKNLRARFEPQ